MTSRDLARRAKRAREIVYGAGLPDDLAAEIVAGYRRLQEEYGEDVRLAVRSSATAEDLPTASFAGQQETFLNVHGEESLLDACRRCFASLFTDRSIHYRVDQGFDHYEVALSIGVMKMVRSDLASSGVMFTLDTESGFRDVVFITGAYGLGENVVQGAVDPDEFYVHKPTLARGHRAVLRRLLGDKAVKMIFVEGETGAHDAQHPHAEGRPGAILPQRRGRARVGRQRGRHRGRTTDSRWTWSGRRTASTARSTSSRHGPRPSPRSARPTSSRATSSKAAATSWSRAARSARRSPRASARVIDSVAQPRRVPTRRSAGRRLDDPGLGAGDEDRLGDRHQPRRTDLPRGDHRPRTRRSRRGGHGQRDHRRAQRHDWSPSRAPRATPGACISGAVSFHVERSDVGDLARPKTKIMINLGNPDLAFKTSFLPNDGVGLARMEFIISESIRAHPLALIHPEQVSDPEARAAMIAPAIQNYPSGEEFFVERLSEGIGTIAAAFWPKPVVVRMSDFKTNEYASLLGGADFEPLESNPMIGFRGASRYAHPAYEEGFALECQAMKRVREEMGLTNVVLMLPFVRRVAEAEQVLARMAELRASTRRERTRGLRHVRDPEQRDLDRSVRAATSTGSRSAPTT